ncbi:flippase [Bifidobacterium mongoliense]|uniref:flippase n=1 Tax=Bifidobacterium mongoliense TaxID=518643 RepID=UPI0030EF5D17
MNFVLSASSILFPLITFPYISRVLLAAGTGRQAFAFSVVQYFVMFASLGIPTYGIRACARVRDDKVELSRTVLELLIINGITTIVVYICFFVSVNIVPNFYSNRELLYINAAAILLNTIGVNWLYQGLEQYTYITTRTIIFKFIALVLMLIFVHNPSDLSRYAVIYVIASQGSSVLNFIKLKDYIQFSHIGRFHFSRHFRPILTFFGMAAATSVYYSLATAMLGFMNNSAEVGYFDAAARVKNILILAVASLGNVLLPRMSYYYKHHESDKFDELVSKALDFVFSLAIPIVILFVIYAREIILILCGPNFISAVPALRILVPAVIFVGLSTTTGMQILIPSGREKIVLISTVVGAFVDFGVNIATLARLGAVGASLGVLAAEFTVLFIQLFYLRSSLGRILRKAHFLQSFVSIVIPIFICIFLKHFFILPPFPNLAVGTILIFGLYAGMLYALKVPLALQAVSMIKNVKRR